MNSLPARTIPHDYYYPSAPSPQPPTTTAVSYSTPLYHPTPSSQLSPSKRLKVEHQFDHSDIPSTYDCPPLLYSSAPSMQQSVARPRTLAPHMNAPEPASPMTIASTLSSQSTPEPSPSRVIIASDHDFALFDDAYQHEQQSKQPLKKMPPSFRAQTSNPANGYNDVYVGCNPSWPQWNGNSEHVSQHHYYPESYSSDAIAIASARAMMQHGRQPADDDEPPALSPSRGGRMPSSSRPSISEHDTPPTPVHSLERPGSTSTAIQHNQNVPKLTRTVSDAVQDELFNPGIAPGTARVNQGYGSHFPQIYQQAPSEHAMARSSMPRIRDTSPFRADSPFHPAHTQAEIQSPRAATFLTARGRREFEKEQEAEALKSRMQREYEELQQAPKTISPKDAYIEYHEPEDGMRGGLFGSSQHEDSASEASYHSQDESKTEQSYSRRPSDVGMEYNIPFAYVNAPHEYGAHHLGMPQYTWTGEHSSQDSEHLPRVSHPDYDYNARSPVFRHEDTTANSGAYSCTVHGCPLRFPTAAKMSKHRREAHRHGTPLNGQSVKAQHQGPHKCIRINPTTGKPCNTVFSRPYDLTRHEDTIHNTVRQKVRCEICNDEKTFSRYDALTRHKKVKHGIDK